MSTYCINTPSFECSSNSSAMLLINHFLTRTKIDNKLKHYFAVTSAFDDEVLLMIITLFQLCAFPMAM